MNDERDYKAEYQKRKEYYKARYQSIKEKHSEQMRVWRSNNKEKVNEYSKSWCQNNKNKRASVMKAWRDANKERVKTYNKHYRESNRGKIVFFMANRRNAKLNRTPCWLTETDFEKIKRKYAYAQRKAEKTGERWVVDHIIPLQGKFVSGLHVPANLRVIKNTTNCSKHNHFDLEKEWRLTA